jgi:putative hydrolase of the HAD superfamily
LGARFHSAVQLHAILFDYGGTLDGPASHWLDRFAALYRELGVEVEHGALKAAFYGADEAAYGALQMRTASLVELMDFHVGHQFGALGLADSSLHGRLVERFVERSETALAASRAVLERLAPRFRLGVVSNFYGNVDRILADAGIAPLLDVIADSTRLGVSKPDPRIFAHAVGALGLSPGAVLHVGDSYERDVRAALRAGLRAAWLVSPDAPDPAEESVVRVRTLDELPQLFDAELLAVGS